MPTTIKFTIFPVYYRPFMVHPLPYLHPIQAGRSLYESLGIEGDNTGENISPLNQNFVELTAAYYIWKNYKKEDIPYWGLCHYRRYFILHFNPLLPYKKVYFMEANEESFQKIFRPKLEATIKQKLDEGYIILSKPYYMWKLKKWSVKQHYAKYHHIESWNLMEDALAKLHPEYMDAFHEFGSGLSMSLYNMLIASYDFWDGYLGWVFSILFEVQKHYTIPTDANQRRVFGFLSERLLNVYALHHHKKNGLKIHYMPVAHLG